MDRRTENTQDAKHKGGTPKCSKHALSSHRGKLSATGPPSKAGHSRKGIHMAKSSKFYVKKDETGELHVYLRGAERFKRLTTDQPTWVDGWVKLVNWKNIKPDHKDLLEVVHSHQQTFLRREISSERMNRPSLVPGMIEEWNDAYPDNPY